MCALVCVYSSMHHLHQPPHQASSCLSVCLSIYLCAPEPGESMFCQLLSPESQAPRSVEIQTSHPHCASFCPLRIKAFHWDWPCRWSKGWRLETHNIHAKTHNNLKSNKIVWLRGGAQFTVNIFSSGVSPHILIMTDLQTNYIFLLAETHLF